VVCLEPDRCSWSVPGLPADTESWPCRNMETDVLRTGRASVSVQELTGPRMKGTARALRFPDMIGLDLPRCEPARLMTRHHEERVYSRRM